PGDIIVKIDGQSFVTSQNVSQYIKNNQGKQFEFIVKRGSEQLEVPVQSIANPAEGQGPTGIALASVGKLTFPWYLAPWQGLKTLWIQTSNIVSGLYKLFAGQVSVKNLGGPVKIAQLTGQVSQMGFIYLLQFTA